MSEGLRVESLHAYYGAAHILFDVRLAAPVGTCVALLGRNGAGKSTLLKAITRAGVRAEGHATFDGRDLLRMPTFEIARLGVELVPEDRRVYRNFSVRENLGLAEAAATRDRPAIGLDRILSTFPTLEPLLGRRGNQLSGGEQQLVAIARAMVANPRLLLMDEPSAGLSPVVLETVGDAIRRLRAGHDLTMVLAEQNARFAVDLADHVVVIDEGRIVFTGTREAFEAEAEVQARYLSV